MPSNQQTIEASLLAEGIKPDLSHLPPIYLISTNAPPGWMDYFGDSLRKCSASVVEDARRATIFLGQINTKKRAQFELRHAGLWTEEVRPTSNTLEGDSKKRSHSIVTEAPRKTQRKSYASNAGSTSGSETEKDQPQDNDADTENGPASFPWDSPSGSNSMNIFVIKLSWLRQSLAQGHLLALEDYLIYQGKRIAAPESDTKSFDLARVDSALSEAVIPATQRMTQDLGDDILQRARDDTPPATSRVSRFISAPYGRRRFRDQGQAGQLGAPAQKPKLLDLQTSSQDGSDHEMPAPPDWLREGRKFSCQRATYQHCPNEEFVDLLVKIRLARSLTGDEIGYRAYSSSIASIAALPTKIVNPSEILRLPGCDSKFANLWIEYKNTGTIEAAGEVDTDETLCILKDFYEIWGVGERTARSFYYDKGWQNRDDVLEYGWQDLNREQQIGLKYYDEFQLPIPRLEVEFILGKVREHAIKVRDDGIEAIAVGGYRRGKIESGDVDIIISHRDPYKTANLVTDIVGSLEDEGWVTHTLTIRLTTTKRGQATLPVKSQERIPGSGFDTLDKALLVWQDINWPTKDHDLNKNPKAKNPNPHRRVDIIISPWKTVGCAVLGWSSGITFQRDLRRYAKVVKGWKFDSSGVRNRTSGLIVELEGPSGVNGSMEDAEKTVFVGLGLDYRQPSERWTR
jgi:DNA polymerase IV